MKFFSRASKTGLPAGNKAINLLRGRQEMRILRRPNSRHAFGNQPYFQASPVDESFAECAAPLRLRAGAGAALVADAVTRLAGRCAARAGDREHHRGADAAS